MHNIATSGKAKKKPTKSDQEAFLNDDASFGSGASDVDGETIEEKAQQFTISKKDVFSMIQCP